jgi:hypothetical protein
LIFAAAAGSVACICIVFVYKKILHFLFSPYLCLWRFVKGINHQGKFFQHCFVKAVTGLRPFDLSFYEPCILETFKVLITLAG